MLKAVSITFLSFLFCLSSGAVEFTVMSFNTMCDFCHKVEEDVFSKRKHHLRKVIEDHKADIIALQEVRSGSQVKELLENFGDHEIFYTDSALVSYADPAIAVNKKKFRVLENGQFWLGPDEGNFSLGWKFALPRQAIWLKLKSLEDGKEFVFISSHFDNRVENLLGSARMMQKFVKDQSSLPVVFAGDTNLVPEYEGYRMLLGDALQNAYDLKESFNVEGTIKSEEDLCYHRKGDTFPECRVDHIILSKSHEWKVKNWKIDARRFGEKSRFPSDHRAVINTLSL